MSTDTNSVQACLGVNCLSALPSNPFEAGWRDGYCPECLDELARDEIRAEQQDARNEVERPTPITDADRHEWHYGFSSMEKSKFGEWVKADTCADLERQLSEARAEIEIGRNLWRASSVCRELTEQRDRLAEALRNLMAVIDSHDIQTEDCDRRGHLYCDCLHRTRKPALAALAALDRKEEE